MMPLPGISRESVSMNSGEMMRLRKRTANPWNLRLFLIWKPRKRKLANEPFPTIHPAAPFFGLGKCSINLSPH